MSTFGKIISNARKKLEISQKDFAASICKEDGTSISAQYLNDIEHDRRNPPSEYIIAQMAQVLKLDKDYLCIVAGTLPQDIVSDLANARPEKVEEVVRAFRRTIKKA